MKQEYSDTTVYIGNALEVLKSLPSESVQCCVTSPPYWGLRDYGHDDQIGLEKTPQEYIAKMVEVFAEVRRVLRSDGVCFANFGDSYAANGGKQVAQTCSTDDLNASASQGTGRRDIIKLGLFKPKDLCMIPARVAIALQDDGWYLRSKITWCKTAPMPESVQDRPTNATEDIYLLTKSKKYFYDQEAVKESLPVPCNLTRTAISGQGNGELANGKRFGSNPRGRNQWNYWLLSPEPCSDAHFATFPTEIPRRAILAGSRQGDVILDPFLGSGTTAMVAQQLGRKCIGIELNPEYLPIIKKRIQANQTRIPLFDPEPTPEPKQTSLMELAI